MRAHEKLKLMASNASWYIGCAAEGLWAGVRDFWSYLTDDWVTGLSCLLSLISTICSLMILARIVAR